MWPGALRPRLPPHPPYPTLRLQAFALRDGKLLWTAALSGSGARLFAATSGDVWAAVAQG